MQSFLRPLYQNPWREKKDQKRQLGGTVSSGDWEKEYVDKGDWIRLSCRFGQAAEKTWRMWVFDTVGKGRGGKVKVDSYLWG